ncbi:MAG: DoxX family protein [Flavobacteriaceae bacterium]
MNIDLYFMAALYGVAGITHFTHTRFFELAVPKRLIYRRFIALFSGVLEILIAIGLLYTPTRSITAVFLMVFLVAIFPANIVQINYYSKKYQQPTLLFWAIRLPMQLGLIYWAYAYV